MPSVMLNVVSMSFTGKQVTLQQQQQQLVWQQCNLLCLMLSSMAFISKQVTHVSPVLEGCCLSTMAVHG